MTGSTGMLFHLNTAETARVSCDDLQWILEKGRPERANPGKDTGYRGISFVATCKDFLVRCIAEKGCDVDGTGLLYLVALPDEFGAVRSAIRLSGHDAFREELSCRVATLQSGLRGGVGLDERSRMADATVPIETVMIEESGRKILICNRSLPRQLASPEVFPATHARISAMGPQIYDGWRAWVRAKTAGGHRAGSHRGSGKHEPARAAAAP